MVWLCSWVWQSSPPPLVTSHHPPLRTLVSPSQLFWCMFCSGSSLRFPAESENCSSTLRHSLHLLPSSLGLNHSSPLWFFPSCFSLLIPGCALSFRKLISPSKPHSLYSGLLCGRSNQTRKLTLQYRRKSPWHTLPSSSQPSSQWPGRLESQHPCWVSRSLSLRATRGWSRSHTRKPVLGKSMDSEIINQRISAHSDSHQWLLVHICQTPYMPLTGRPP